MDTPPPQLAPIELSKEVDQLIEWLTARGLNVAASRIPAYKKILDLFPSLDEFNPSQNEEHRQKAEEYLYMLREVHELLWIKKGLDSDAPEGLMDLLKIVIGGRPFARDDTDTKARNYQFELRIASYFLQRNYRVDMSTTTDIIATRHDVTFFVECKRLISHKQVKKRIKDAATQLKLRSAKPGLRAASIAAFDVTGLAYPHQGLTWGVTNEQCKDIIQNKLNEIDRAYEWQTLLRHKRTIGAWLQIHIPSLNIELGGPTTRFSSKFLVMAPDTGFRRYAFEQFQEVYEAAS